MFVDLLIAYTQQAGHGLWSSVGSTAI